MITVDEAHKWALAARGAIGQAASVKEACLALLDVAGAARGEQDHARREALCAIWYEARDFLGVPEPDPAELRLAEEVETSRNNDASAGLPKEDPRTVAEEVARILDAPVPDLPLVLGDVVRLQSATRRIREANLPAGEQDRLLLHLGPRIKQAAIPGLALRAVLAELDDPEAPPLPPERWEQAQRRMRTAGYSEDPCSLSPIATEEELRRYERLRSSFNKLAEIRKNALPLVGGQR
jgi:hypothetical protein